MEIAATLDRIAHSLEEARAAAQVIADGDPSAMSELDAEVDAMATHVAQLKSITRSGPPA
jgi:methylaspartate ammonia-lyase